MKKLILISAISASFAVQAAFTPNNWTDEMTDTKVFSEYTSVKTSGYRNHQTFGWECRLRNGSPQADSIELMYGGSESVATPNSVVKIQVRVDDGKVYNLNGKNYNNSYRSGLIRAVPDELYSELMSGNKMHLKISNHGQNRVMETLSLSGSTASLNRMQKNCGVSIGESPEVTAAKKAINAEYDARIEKLEAERKAKLAEL